MLNELGERRRWFDAQWPELEEKSSPWRFLTRLLPLDVRSNRTCPCCGYPTLKRRDWYEICSVCRWEDDGHDDADAQEVSSANSDPEGRQVTLTQARADFSQYRNSLASDGGDSQGSGDATAAQLVGLFDRLLATSRAEHREPVKSPEVRKLFREVKGLLGRVV